MKWLLFLLLGVVVASPVTAQVAVRSSSETATIVLYRPSHFVGVLNNIILKAEGRELCRLSNNRSATVVVKPGGFDLKAQAGPAILLPARNKLTFDTEAGKTYYVKVSPGFFKVNMHLVDAEKAQQEMQRVKPDRCAQSSVAYR